MANTTWNPADLVAVLLSGGNLTATGNGQGAVRSVVSASSGKYYWECTVPSWFGQAQVGIANATATLSTVAAAGNGACVVIQGGGIYYNNTNSGLSLGGQSNGATISCALDIGANLFWMRTAPAGNWNGSGTANPATGTGGISISAISGSAIYPLAAFTGAGASIVANFGDSAFSGTVPSGFTAGVPAGAAAQARAMVLA